MNWPKWRVEATPSGKGARLFVDDEDVTTERPIWGIDVKVRVGNVTQLVTYEHADITITGEGPIKTMHHGCDDCGGHEWSE